MNKGTSSVVVSALVATTLISPVAVYADAISPAIRDAGKSYSKEAPDSAYYGTGIGGRAMEASALRFDCERLLQDSEWDQAIAKAKKACQLDPADPECHLLLARALTKKLQTTPGAVDEKLLGQALTEWKLIWLHDADTSEQSEGKYNYMRMVRVAHALAKQKQIEAKERARAKEALAQQRAKQAIAQQQTPASDETAGNGGGRDSGKDNGRDGGRDGGKDNGKNVSKEVDSDNASSAFDEPVHKKKRFLLF